MGNPPLSCDVSSAAASFINVSDAAGGAVLIYSHADRVLWANSGQRQIAPVSDYTNESHSSLFWKLLAAGLIGNRMALANPAEWLDQVRIARRLNQGLDWISEHPSGRMATAHRIFDNGICIQSRITLATPCAERYFAHKLNGDSLNGLVKSHNGWEAFALALDSIEIAICLVEKNGKILHRNASFSDLLCRGDFFYANDHGNISCLDLNENAALQNAIFTAISGKDVQHFLPISLNGTLNFMAISSGEYPGTAVLLVSRFGEDEEYVARALERVLGLHPAEAQVAAMVGSGLAPSEIARRRATTEGTIYTQIRNIKAKVKGTKFAVVDLVGLAGLVVKIAAITSVKRSRKN